MVLPYDVTLPGVRNTYCHYTVYTVRGVTMQIVATQFVTEYNTWCHNSGITITSQFSESQYIVSQYRVLNTRCPNMLSKYRVLQYR